MKRLAPARAFLIAALLLALAASACSLVRGARLYRSGSAALDRADTQQAIEELERAAQIVPTASAIQNHLGLAYAAASREGDARIAFQRALELDCDNLAAQQNLHALEAGAVGVAASGSGDSP